MEGRVCADITILDVEKQNELDLVDNIYDTETFLEEYDILM